MKYISIPILLALTVNFSYAQKVSTSGDISYRARSTDSECQIKGYDCSLKNKCVKDLSLRPFARFHPKYKKAMKDVIANPGHIINWPQIYYVCPLRN